MRRLSNLPRPEPDPLTVLRDRVAAASRRGITRGHPDWLEYQLDLGRLPIVCRLCRRVTGGPAWCQRDECQADRARIAARLRRQESYPEVRRRVR